MVVVVQLAERQIVALEVKSSILFDHPRNLNSKASLSVRPENLLIFIGVSPSGKALDSDSNIA